MNIPRRSATLVAALMIAFLSLFLAACSSPAPRPTAAKEDATRASGATRPPGSGGYYKDDGPSNETPANLSAIPEPVPRWEPINRGAARPYVIFGRSYTPNGEVKSFRQRGVASWYGKKFHGKLTSIGERYDMFAYSAAHPTLALPSYVRVTNPANGQQVVVRINDRGPFHADRVIDLSYIAAHKLGLIGRGSGEVLVESIIPGERDDGKLARAAEPPTAPKPDAGMDGERGFFVQLGAFGNADNAENLRVHVSRELEWLDQPVRVFSGHNLHRVQVGPFADRAGADKAASRMSSDLASATSIVIR